MALNKKIESAFTKNPLVDYELGNTTNIAAEPDTTYMTKEAIEKLLPLAEKLVKFAQMTRNLKGSGLDEGASTRLLVHAGKLIAAGIDPVIACQSAIAQAVTDDADMLHAMQELSSSVF
jgi:hypothetical protein